MMNKLGITIDDMVRKRQGRSDDEGDKASITGMIEHRKGAIAMENDAKLSEKHDEMKKMADDSISAQSGEMSQMKEWNKTRLGVRAPSTHKRMMH